MSNEIQFEIDELVTQYILHPELRDIFVEGIKDKNFYSRFLNKLCINDDVHCYEIGCVKIPSKILRKYNLFTGCERDKVIAFALELDRILPKDSKSVTCIADADFNYLFANIFDCHLLLYTDYTCLEMYTLRCDVLSEFLSVMIGVFPISPDRIIKQITPILVDLFLVRASNIRLDLGMKWLDIKSRRCRIERTGEIHFDINAFIKHYLQYNNMQSEEKNFCKTFKELKQLVSKDKRKFIRGHDYIIILGIYLYKLRNRLRHWKEQPDDLIGALLLCLDADEMRKERLFCDIISSMS